MKKFLSLVLALVMTMSLVTVSAGAKDFTDNDKITYDEAVAVMSAAKVIDGYAEGDFRPTNTLTRGAAAKIICNLILGPTTASALVADAAPYKDVPTTNPFAGYIAYCQKEGIISGYADGTFKPANTLTGYAFMKMLLGALGYDSAIEGYTGANWSIAVAKQAINAGLNNSLKGSFNGVKTVTREEACLYAFNTLKATMVEYDNRIVVGEGSSAVAISGVRKDLTWNKGTLNDGKIKKDGDVQFGEQYFEKLTRTDDTDDFGRPASKWTYDKKDVGTYVNYDLLVSEYTTKVKGGDVYSDIGSTAADYDLTYWVDGVKETDAKKIKAQSSQIAKKNDDTMLTSGKGALTQIFVDNDDEDLTIVEINTYLAETDDYNEKKETLKFNEIYGYGSVDDVELDDIASIKDYKDGDMVLLTIADGEVKTITPAETVKNVELDEFSRKDVDAYVVTGKTQYDFAKTGKASYSLGNDVLTAYDKNNLDDTTYNLYLDSYGYLIGIEKVDGDDQYVFITAYEKYSSYLTSKLTDASAIFADGTQKTIKVDLKKSFENTDKDGKEIYAGWTGSGDRNVNLWFKYTVKDENTYRLELATKQFHDNRGEKETSDVVMTIDSKHPAQKATSIPSGANAAMKDNFFYGNADTTYITVNVDEMDKDVVIDDVENVTTGIKNVSIDVYSKAKALKEAKLTSSAHVAHGIYTVYDGGYAVASIVIGDDGATSDKFAFLYGAAKKESYSKSEKLYTWVMDAIVDGQKTTITFKSELPSTMTDAAEAGELYKISYNKDGYATEATLAQHGSDYVWVDEYKDDPTAKDIVKTTFGTSSQSKVDLTADGDTLWITNATSNRGIVLADNCPAIIVEQKTSSGNEVDKVVEYASVAKAIKALDNYGAAKNFDGTIIVTLKDGVATSVILTDTVVKVDHKKEDTVAGVTASLKTSADGKGLTLHVTGMTTETVTYKVIATDIRSQNSAVVKTGDIKAEYTKVVDVTDSTMSYAVEVTVDGKTMTVSL